MSSDLDPRRRNELFDLASPASYLVSYVERLRQAALAVDGDALARACSLIEQAAASGNRIFAAGNGGSAAIADHLCCDWTKGTHVHGMPTIDTTSLSANVALYTAVANDFGFEKVFATQLAMVARPGDVLIAISSSGNSENILQAVAEARSNGLATVGLSGFSGGRLKDSVDVSLHVDVANYGVVEDVHQMIMHVIAQFIAGHRDLKSAGQ